MAKENAIKEILFAWKKKVFALGSWFAKLIRVFRRSLLYKEKIDSANCFNVPIIINNRNRLTYLKQMVDQLSGFGYKNIYVLTGGLQQLLKDANN